jgi:hypothetical protein
MTNEERITKWLVEAMPILKNDTEDFDIAMTYVRQDMPYELGLNRDELDWDIIEVEARRLW